MHSPLDTLKPYQRIYKKTVDRYDFRVATPLDVEGIVALWPEHWEEAHYKDRGIEPDEDRYAEWVQAKIEYGSGVFLLALDRGKSSWPMKHKEEIVGFFAYTLDHNFSVKPVAVMGTFFVRKAHRRTAVPAILFELGLDLAAADGACAFHAPIASETASARALENSFRKAGFTTIGTMMGRSL